MTQIQLPERMLAGAKPVNIEMMPRLLPRDNISAISASITLGTRPRSPYAAIYWRLVLSNKLAVYKMAKETTKIDESVSKLSSLINDVKDDIATLKTDTAVMKTDIGAMQPDVKTLTADVSEIRDSISFFKGAVWIGGVALTVIFVLCGIIYNSSMGQFIEFKKETIEAFKDYKKSSDAKFQTIDSRMQTFDVNSARTNTILERIEVQLKQSK